MADKGQGGWEGKEFFEPLSEFNVILMKKDKAKKREKIRCKYTC